MGPAIHLANALDLLEAFFRDGFYTLLSCPIREVRFNLTTLDSRLVYCLYYIWPPQGDTSPRGALNDGRVKKEPFGYDANCAAIGNARRVHA